MSILLTGAGGLFTRLGQYVGLLNGVNAYRGGTADGQLVKDTQDLLAQLDSDTPAVRATAAAVLSGYPSAQTGLGSYLTLVQKAAQNLLITMANNDTPLVQQTVTYALNLLKTQMLASGSYVNPNTVTATPTPAAGNLGNGAVICGTRDARGFQLDNLLAETIQVACTAEAAGAGSLTFSGALAQPDPLNWAWPAGSGCNKSLTSLDAAASGNLAAGGAFDSFTSNLPASWTATVGTAGTDFGAAGAGYKGANALKLIGGTSVLTDLTQTVAGLTARTPYAINLWLKADVVPASGTLVVDLYNGSATINDEAGNPCSLTIGLSGITTSYAAHGAVFQIADPLPATVTLRVRLSAALPAGSNVFVDQLALQAATQLGTYLGDTIFAAVATGSVDWSLRDTLTLVTANNRACQWQQAFDRLFGCRALGYVLPTSGTTLINDSLIA